MTNFEKYKDELLKIKGHFAFNENTRKISKCDCITSCEDCLFKDTNCLESNKIEWLYEEYKEPILSDDELELIKAIGKISGKEYKYVARNACDVIRLFETKPDVSKSGSYYGESTHINISVRPEGKVYFSNIKHEYGLYDIENKCFIKEEGDD